MISEPSEQAKAEAEAQGAASLAANIAASEQRQREARAFQEAGNTVNVPDVTAGPRPE